MNLKDKRKMEQEDLKRQRKDEVITAALEVFKRHGIENTKMTDIAEKAEIGVASVYRYFKTKPDLAVEAARKLWEDEVKEIYVSYTDEAFQNKNGVTKVKEILEVFLKLYQDHTDFMRFIDEFDRYVVKEKISTEKLREYEKGIIDLETIMTNALECGKKDGTIRSDLDGGQFYFSITHALMSLCQKLILRGNVLESDKYVDGEQQIKTIIDMAVKYII